MVDVTPRETEKTRGLLFEIVLIVVLLAGLVTSEAACGRKQGSERAAPAQSAAEPAPTPDVGEPPSIRQTAAPGEAPFSAVKIPFEAKVDDQGRIWVLDSANSRLRLFDRDGGFLGGWGGNGGGKFFFKYPEGLAISRDGLYVADTWNHRVVRFSLAGEWKGSSTGFMGPRRVAVGPDGSVWVADTGTSRVLQYDAELQNRLTVGPSGTGPGEFKGPVSIAVASSGTVFVTDPGNARIQLLDKDGPYISSWKVAWLDTSWQAHIEIGRNETVYLSHPDGGEVLSFSRSGIPDRRWDTADSADKFVPPGRPRNRPQTRHPLRGRQSDEQNSQSGAVAGQDSLTEIGFPESPERWLAAAPKERLIVLLAAAFPLLTLFTRFYRLGERPLHHDESIGFLVFWTLGPLVIYAWAREKVPWLTVHSLAAGHDPRPYQHSEPLATRYAAGRQTTPGRSSPGPTGLTLDRKNSVLYVVNSDTNSIAKLRLSRK